jgi:hypothetical protein
MMHFVSADLSPRIQHDVSELARFFTELSVCEYYFVTRKPSSIALASIINAFELMGANRVNPRYKTQFLNNVVGFGLDISDDDEIIECYEKLREMYISGGYGYTSFLIEYVVPPNSSSTNKRKRVQGGNKGDRSCCDGGGDVIAST